MNTKTSAAVRAALASSMVAQPVQLWQANPGAAEAAPDDLKEMIQDAAKKAADGREAVRKAHEDLDGRIGKIDADLEKNGRETSEAKEAFQKSVDGLARVEGELEDLSKKLQSLQAGGGAANDAKSIGERLEARKEAIDAYAGGNLELLKHQGPIESKAPVTSDPTTSVGLLIEPLRRPGIQTEPEQPLWVRDLIPTVSISTNAVEWVREVEGSFTSAAGFQVSEGDAKPEAGPPRFELMSDTVKTIAHWIPITRQALADLPLLRSLIESKMIRGLKVFEEAQIMFGTGTGGTLLGIMPQATPFDVTKSKAGDTRVDQLRRSILQSTLSLYPADTVMLSPTDWCEIELMKTDTNAYLFSNPTSGAEKRLWGKRVVEQIGMPEGQFLTGGFATGATLWDREKVIVRIAEQHGTFFTENMVALLVEERIMLTVERPKAFVKGTFA